MPHEVVVPNDTGLVFWIQTLSVHELERLTMLIQSEYKRRGLERNQNTR